MDKRAAFIAHYEQLKARLNENEPLLFMDAMHPTQATKITSGWIRKGVDKPIKNNNSRTRLNVVVAFRLGHLAEAVIVPTFRTTFKNKSAGIHYPDNQ
jgi:hypothetical protein